ATVQVKVKFLEPDQYVKPEMNARVSFLAEEAADAKAKTSEKFLIVPRRAVLDREEGQAVYVVSGGVVQAKRVTIAKESGTDAYISAGLSGSESIIVGDALNRVKAGDRVVVK